MFKKYTSKDFWLVAMLASVAAVSAFVFYAIPGPVAVNLGLIEPVVETQLAQVVPSSPTTIAITNQSELQTTLTAAQGGETIFLADGNYGSLAITNRSFTSPVTIKAQNKGKAAFTSLAISNSSYIRIDGIHVSGLDNGASGSKLASISSGSHHIELLNSELNALVDSDYSGYYGLALSDSRDLTITNNYIHDTRIGVYFERVVNTVFGDNITNYIGEDDMKVSGVDGLTIKNNIGGGYHFPLSGYHSDFIQGQGSNSQNVTISGNVYLAQNASSTNVQGIFLSDVTYTNVLIENNIIHTGMGSGITISAGTNNIIRNNTVLHIPYSTLSKSTLVNGVASSSDNIYTNWQTSTTNVVIVQGVYNYSAYYQGVKDSAGVGLKISDFKPVVGSPAETKGAYVRINELLNTTAAPIPPPTLTLTTSTTSLTTGSTATLTWSTTNATDCLASSAWSGSKTTSGSEVTAELNAVGIQTYTLACTGAGGNITQSVSVTVSAPVITILDADKDSIADSLDNCPTTANADQSDRDKDSVGDLCDSTPDGVVATSTWSSAYKAGTTVQTTNRLNVRSVSGGQVIGKQSAGVTGVVQDKTPVVLKGYTWIYVDFTTGSDGWVADSFLKKI